MILASAHPKISDFRMKRGRAYIRFYGTAQFDVGVRLKKGVRAERALRSRASIIFIAYA